jgi:DNA-binding CsgD family transcriptional regulator
MKRFSDLLIHIEVSLNGYEYYQIDNLSLVESDAFNETISIILERLELFGNIQQRLNIHSENKIFICLKSGNATTYAEHLENNRGSFNVLTKREKEILIFMSKGYVQGRIYPLLGISKNTFQQYRKSIYKKMQFKNKVQLAIWCDKYLIHFLRTV